MSAPRLGRRLVLEALQRVPDGAGGFAEIWATLGTIWGEVQVASGRDAAGQEVILTSAAYRIKVRGAPQGAPSRPVAGQRFRDGGRVFGILAVSEADTAGRHLTCFAQEEAPV